MPSIPEKKKTKRSEKSQIVTSSPYKQSLIDNISDQKDKHSKAPKKKPVGNKNRQSNKKCGRKSKFAKLDTVSVETEDNAQCPTCDRLCTESLAGEEWVQCSVCQEWLHEECCSFVTPTTATCDICV